MMSLFKLVDQMLLLLNTFLHLRYKALDLLSGQSILILYSALLLGLLLLCIMALLFVRQMSSVCLHVTEQLFSNLLDLKAFSSLLLFIAMTIAMTSVYIVLLLSLACLRLLSKVALKLLNLF